MSAPDRFAQVLFGAASLDEVPFDRVRQAVATHGVACVRGIVDRGAIQETLRHMRAAFDVTLDRKHDPKDSDAVRRNFQKLQIGANSGVDSRRTLGRFVRANYNPIFADDVHGMRAHFVTLARFLNGLMSQPTDFGVFGTEDGYWMCTRLLQYPRGGGFMVPHRDVYAQTAAADGGRPFFQPLLLLSEKGVDYADGGAYVDVDDERYRYEDHCRAGDIVVYDGRSIHGVADIDPMADVDLVTYSGRVVALVSLYRHLESGGTEYARLNQRAVGTVGLGG